SGIAFLGDAAHFVSLGRKRITDLRDDGCVTAAVAFANGERPRTLFGYSPSTPAVAARNGSAVLQSYDADSHLFRRTVTPGASGAAVVSIPSCKIGCGPDREFQDRHSQPRRQGRAISADHHGGSARPAAQIRLVSLRFSGKLLRSCR